MNSELFFSLCYQLRNKETVYRYCFLVSFWNTPIRVAKRGRGWGELEVIGLWQFMVYANEVGLFGKLNKKKKTIDRVLILVLNYHTCFMFLLRH